jgi:hypothetical protein
MSHNNSHVVGKMSVGDMAKENGTAVQYYPSKSPYI